MIPKDPPFRSKTLIKYARGQTCVQCGAVNASEGAHLTTKGASGMSQKTDDFMLAHLCRQCHYAHDTHDRGNFELKLEMLRRTLKRLFREDVLCVQKP